MSWNFIQIKISSLYYIMITLGHRLMKAGSSIGHKMGSAARTIGHKVVPPVVDGVNTALTVVNTANKERNLLTRGR